MKLRSPTVVQFHPVYAYLRLVELRKRFAAIDVTVFPKRTRVTLAQPVRLLLEASPTMSREADVVSAYSTRVGLSL